MNTFNGDLLPDMFEAPTSTADFELAAMAALHPLSLKARFRSAFKGLKVLITSILLTPEFICICPGKGKLS